MKSKNTISSMSQRALESDSNLIDQLKEEIEKIKKPFLNRVEFSKLRIENKVRESNKEKEKLFRSKEVIENLIEKETEEEFETPTLQYQITSETDENKNETKLQSQYPSDFEDKKQNSVEIEKSHITEWLGRDKERIFKNSSAMIDELETVLNKKLPSNQIKKKETYSYRRDEKEMLERIFSSLKNPTENSVTFKKIYEFFDQCQLFYEVYDIIPKELQDLVSSSAHTYPDRLTKKEFFDLFLINPQARKFDELENKVLKNCCLEEQYWKELEQLFSQLDTFGCGTVRTSEFFHKMKTVSASKELLEAKTIFYPNVKKYYSLKRVLFELENRKTQPEKLEWVELKSQIINFSHTEYPSMDEIFLRRIKAGYIEKDSNTFLLKSDTLAILKKEFERCPKFCESFVKCRYFCEELLLMESIELKKDEPIRQNSNGKGYVNLLSNIRMLQLKGPEFFDMDEMLTYFSVKGFQQEENLRHFKESFDTKSTASDEEFEERKKEQIRLKRMKSLDNMKKIMMKSPEEISGKQRKKCSFKPVKIEEFNLTKPRDHLTIREMKVKEMIEEKKLKEESEIKPFVTANPLPASINLQRYHKEQNKQKMKMELERERFNKKYEKYQKQLSYLQATTKLFEKPNSLNEEDKQFLKSEKKKEFEHTPISWFVKERNLLNVIESEKEERRKNRLRETREKYEYGYWRNMPYQYDQNEEEDLTHKSEDSIDIHVKEIQEEKTQNHQEKLKTTIVPDFAKLQKEFMQELESKKKMKSPTVVKEFNLSVSKKKPLEYQEEIQTKRPETPKKEKDLNKRESVPVIIGTTKKYESMVELTQMKIAQKNYEAEMKKLEEKERKKKEKAFAKFMNKVLREENLKSKRESADKTTRRNNSSSRIEHESELRKIYEKVLSRPFLFQIAGEESKGMKKQGKYSKKHKKSVPEKVKIPSDELKLEIPPLKYIDSEEFPVEYENGKAFESDEEEEQRYFVNEFQSDSHLQEEESFAEKIIENQRDSSYKVNSFAEHLNQSF